MGVNDGNLSESRIGLGPGASGDGRSKRYVAWAAAAALITAAGAVFAAGAVADSDATKSRQAFESSSAEIASTLQLAIEHEEDLNLSGAAYLAGNPDGSNAQFLKWSDSIQALTRYPELHDYGNAVIVQAPELAAFAARAEADPWSPLGPSGNFQVEPAGDRAYYCFGTVGQVRDAQVGAPAGQDFCATGLGPALLDARDTGESSYAPFTVGADSVLGVSTPYYRGGVIPATVEGRQAAFLGWFGMTTVPKLLLDRALQGHPGTLVTFRYKTGSSDAEFSSGNAPAGAQSVTTDLHNGWTVQISGAVADGGIVSNGPALALLLAGVLLSVLLGVLVFVLGTSRERALRLVRERTVELRGAQAQLVDAARQAGMAEIATNVLHNVGNVLNSVNVSANLVCQRVRGSKAGGLVKAVALMNEHTGDLGGFLTTDARGKALPGYLEQLAATLAIEREGIDAELLRLTQGVAHIKEIVAAQQSLAGVSGVIESVRVSDLVEEALHMAGINEDEVRVIRDFPANPLLALDRRRILLILLNLISNAMNAMKGNAGRPRELSIRAEVIDGQGLSITVADTGVGIPSENLARIFVHGFTTHTGGHGFGLHSSALAAKEMGGALTVEESAGANGAAFTLHVPLDRERVPA
ncbi:ATP-binding protein [Pseudarthrobacter sp. N5]|uniref:ATP-binding protein n=1 Tax=Pseudarthrobacter sp. N5 TaxID=3418416 RepID=UPI003CEE11BD